MLQTHVPTSAPSRSVSQRLLRNILSNWAGFAVHAAVAFFLTPYILRAVGQELYGVWAIVTSVTGYYGLLDLGLRSGLTQYLTRYLASRDFEAMNRSASTGFFILLAIAAAVLAAGLGLSLWFPLLLHLQPESERVAQLAVAIVSVGFAVQFIFFTFSAVLTADQRFDVANGIGITTRLVTAAATVLALRAGGGLVALSWLTLASILVDYFLRMLAAYWLVPTLRIRLGYVAKASAREFIGYGLWSAIVQMGLRVVSYTDALVIGAFMPAAAVTPFSLAISLVNYLSDALFPVAQVFFPVFTQFDARAETEEIKRVYLQASRLMLLLSLSAGLLSGLCAHGFLLLWVGPSVLSGNQWGSAATLFQVLVVGASVTAWQRIGSQVLMGTRRVKLQAGLFLGEAVCNLGLSLALVRPLGLLGVALGTTIPALLFNVALHPYFTCRALGLPLRRYWLAVAPRPCLALGLSAVALYVFQQGLSDQGSWFALLSRTTVETGIVLLIAMVIGLRSGERDQVLVGPLRSMFVRAGR